MVLISLKSISPITSPTLLPSHHLHHSSSSIQLKLHSIKHLIGLYYKLILIFTLGFMIYFSNLNQSFHDHQTHQIHDQLKLNQTTKLTHQLNVQLPGWIKSINPLPTTSLLENHLREEEEEEEDLMSECESNWISFGIPCHSIQNQTTTLDILWTWVNGSSSTTTNQSIKDHLPDYLIREHDELRYSMRSVMKSIPSNLMNKLHLFTEDHLFHPHSFGSIPTWLNSSFINHPIFLHHHSQAFKISLNYLKSLNLSQSLNSSDFKNHHLNSIKWRNSVIPSHNSLAIESQIPHLENLGKTLLYLNDDTFLLRSFSSGDLVTSSYGPVFRIQWDLKVQDRLPNSSLDSISSNGEWPSLGYSNWLLSNRFGKRDRRYLYHVAKVLPVDSMNELSKIWQDELSESASSAFRSQLPEINLPFLTTWYHIEKHRESILYSHIMLKSDLNSDGKISSTEFQSMLNDLSIKPNQTILKVSTPNRLTNHPNMIRNVLKQSDYPLQTEYQWISSDGYPSFENELPNYSSSNHQVQGEKVCEINLEICFGNLTRLDTKEGIKSEDLFKRIGFEYIECGDCLITKIVEQSGLSNSLEFALPSMTTTTSSSSSSSSSNWFITFIQILGFENQKKKKLPKNLIGLEKNWKLLTFFKMNRSHSENKRWIGISLLKKYQYVIGHTPNTFRAITSEIGAKKFLEPLILNQDLKAAMVTVNDLIIEIGAIQVFKNWLIQLWPEKLEFEI